MKKNKLPLLFIPLLLTGCSSILGSQIPLDNKEEEDIVIATEEKEEEQHEATLEVINEEVPEVVSETVVEETIVEETIVEESIVEETIFEEEISETIVEEEIVAPTQEEERPIYNENGEFISPVYRPTGTTDVNTLNLDVRSHEATITDSGRVNQKMDIVYLDYNYAGLEDLGYYWLDVKVSVTAREVNDGYQYLFLYNTPNCQSVGESLLENFIPSVGDGIKQGMLFKEQFEIGPGYKKTSWEEREFRFYVYVGNMVDNIYLRYGANGILADTWVNKDIKVTVTPKMSKN